MVRSRVVVIGAGFAGIGMAGTLLERGHTDVTVVESSAGVGGTWRHNTYPGAGCDVPSHLYSLSFCPKPDWQRRYATQPEILAYLEDCATRLGVRPHLRLRTTVVSATWDHDRAVWVLETQTATDDGAVTGTLEAEVLISAVGQLNRPHLPEVPGLDSFAGESFHSARWRHDVDLTGRRVGVLGTGASAIQFVPHVAAAAQHTTLFQRSAPYIIPKSDAPYPSWQQSLYRRVPAALRASRAKQYLTHEARAVAFVSRPRLMAANQRVAMRRLARDVADPGLRERLTPSYPMGCKRLLLSNDWYDVMQRADVDVVTTAIREVVPDGVVTADGVHHACDVLIHGTGFRASGFLMPMTVTGRDGVDLHELWQGGASAHLGVSVAGFPNLFLLYGPQTNLGHNSIVFMIEQQIGYVVQALDLLATQRLAWLDVRPQVQTRWDSQIRRMSAGTVWESGCRSWYTTPDGRNVNNWPGYTVGYRRRLRHLDLGDHETGVVGAAPVAAAVAGSG